MPAHNVNTAALEMVLEAAQRFEKLTETLNLTPVDTEDFSLSTAVLMMERVLEVADGNANTVALLEEREH